MSEMIFFSFLEEVKEKGESENVDKIKKFEEMRRISGKTVQRFEPSYLMEIIRFTSVLLLFTILFWYFGSLGYSK